MNKYNKNLIWLVFSIFAGLVMSSNAEAQYTNSISSEIEFRVTIEGSYYADSDPSGLLAQVQTNASDASISTGDPNGDGHEIIEVTIEEIEEYDEFGSLIGSYQDTTEAATGEYIIIPDSTSSDTDESSPTPDDFYNPIILYEYDVLAGSPEGAAAGKTVYLDEIGAPGEIVWEVDAMPVRDANNQIVCYSPTGNQRDSGYRVGEYEVEPTCEADFSSAAGSMILRFPMGYGLTGERPGFLRVHQINPGSHLFSPRIFEDKTSPGTEVLRDSQYLIRQVVSRDMITDVKVISDHEFHLNLFYRSPKSVRGVDGLYQTGATPFRQFVIKNPQPDAKTPSAIVIEDHMKNRIETTSFKWKTETEGGADEWTHIKGASGFVETVTESYDKEARRLTKKFILGEGKHKIERHEIYGDFPFGRKLIAEIVDPKGDKPSKRTISYFENRDEPFRFGKVKQRIGFDGSWEKLDYDEAGRLGLKVTPWKDSPVESAPNEAQATYYGYEGLPSGHPDYRPFGRLEIQTTKVLGISTSRSFGYRAINYDGGKFEITEQAASPEGGFGGLGNRRTLSTYFPNYAGVASSGKLRQQISSDGSVRTYQYETGIYLGAEAMPGDFVVDGEFAFDRKTEVTAGTIAHPDGIPGKTTKSVSIADFHGNQVYQQTLVRTDPLRNNGKKWSEITWQGHAYNEAGKKTLSRDQTGVIAEYRYSPCCSKLEWHRDANGVETSYAYNKAGEKILERKVTPGRKPIEKHLVYENGRVVQEIIESDGLELVTSRSYDKQGRLKSTTSPDGLTTSFKAEESNRRSITILPNNTTRVQDRFLDGRTKISHGTATIAQYYDYGVDAETGDRWSETITAKADGPRWSRSITNALGQSLRSEQPGSGEGVVIASHNRYDERGRLAVSAQSWRHSEKAAGADSENGSEPTMIGSPKLYVYDEETNEVLMSGSDLNGNGILEPGTDLVSKSESSFEKIDGNWYQISKQYAWPEIGNGEPILASESRRRVNGLGIPHEKYGVLISESISRQRSANPDDDLKLNTENLTLETKSQTFRDPKTGLVTSISTTPTGLQTIQRSKAGQVLTNSMIDPENPDQIIEMSFAYDTLGRRIASTDPRTGTSKTEYDPETGRVIAQIDSAGHRSTVDYYPVGHKNAGQMKSTTNPDGKTQYVAYTNLGQQLATWGDTSYPLDYQYNDYGEMIGMRTFKTSPATNPAELPKVGSTTQWHYDEATGQLLKKEYADGHGPEYQYSPTGQLLTRTWARERSKEQEVGSKEGKLGAESSKSEAGAQPLAAPNPDSQPLNPSTPSRLATKYSYDEKTNLLTNVTYPDGTGITYTHDAFGRTTKVTDLTGSRAFEYHKKTGQLIAEHVTVGTGEDAFTYKIDRSYTELGQPEKVALSGDLKLNTENVKLSHEVAYAWTKTGQLAAVTSPAGKFSYKYDPNNPTLLRGITAPAHTVTYDYEPDRNLIASVTNRSSDPTIKDPISQYRYRNDSLNRRDLIVQSGLAFQQLSTGENTIEVAYNDRSEVTGTKSHAGIPADPAAFDVKSSTFDVQRSQSFVFDGIGNRKSQTTELGDQRSAISYESNSLNQYTAIRAEEKDKNNLRASAPLRETSPSHDQDGNLLEDDRNTYTWNVENRLTTVESKDGKSRTEYLYDYQGRRTVKKSFTRTNSTENFKLQTENSYIYDGWNLLAEIENGQAQTYTWGRDLSGSMQGAGGVGGLLAITTPEFDVQSSTFDVQRSKNRFAIYDGNGNIGQMIAENSSIKAAYQYSSFGSVTATFGEEAESNPWRFSTKPVEVNTGWSYYGFRYYNPAEGRWASRDLIAERGGVNLYGFVGNDGVGKIDLIGLFAGGYACCGGKNYSYHSSKSCCDGKVIYDTKTHCCRFPKGVTALEGQKETGVRYCNSKGGRDHEANHRGLETDSIPCTSLYRDVPWYQVPFITTAPWIQDDPTIPRDPVTGEAVNKNEVKLDPCMYDLEKFSKCVDSKLKPLIGTTVEFNFCTANNCRGQTERIVRECKHEASLTRRN